MVAVIKLGENEHPADQVYAWLSVDAKGNEGILSVTTPLGHTPLVCMHDRLLPIFATMARNTSRATGVHVRLVRFTRAEVIEDVGG